MILNEYGMVVAYFKAYTDILMEGLRKTAKNVSQNSRSVNRDWNRGPHGYKAALLGTVALGPCISLPSTNSSWAQ